MNALLTIVEPGLATTVQDLGRTGHYNVGIPQGGAMDALSADFANAAVGNPPGAAVLECTYTGPVFSCSEDVRLAVAGAPVDVVVDGSKRPQWEPIELKAGQQVSFGVIRGGTRFYLAFAGGVDVPEVLGSRSTYTLGGLGGFQGRKLAAADEVPVGGTCEVGPGWAIPGELRPDFPRSAQIRVVRGLYDHRLSDEGRRVFYQSEWTLTPVADRTGLRFKGPGVQWQQRQQPFGAGSDPSNIVDAGYAVGSIQIPGGTEPIVLHRDAVSGGGYAMIATVIGADMDLLGRLAPGTTARFVPVSMADALVARAQLGELRAAVRAG